MRTVIPEYIIYLFKDIYVCDIVGEVVWRQESIRIFMYVILLGKLFG